MNDPRDPGDIADENWKQHKEDGVPLPGITDRDVHRRSVVKENATSKEAVEQAAERLGLGYTTDLGFKVFGGGEAAIRAIEIIQSLEAKVAKLRKRLEWMCSECRTVFQAEDLHKGPRCVLCPGCGEAGMHTIDELHRAEAEAEVAKLKAELAEMTHQLEIADAEIEELGG